MAIAAAIRVSFDTPNDQAVCIARNIADVLGESNPRFDRARFLKAAGVA